MKYYKTIVNGIITMIGSGSAVHESQTEITKEEYDSLMAVINGRPVDTFESVYELKENGMYEPRPRTHNEIIDWYVQIILIGTVTLDEIPQEYRAEVEAKMPVSEEEQWAKEIMEEVSEYGY